MSKPIALATCGLRLSGEPDDDALGAALDARGLLFERPRWDDPAVEWARYGAVVLRSVWDYHEHAAAFGAWIDALAGRTRVLNPAPVVHWNARKHYLRELEARGVAIAPTRWLAADERVDLEHECRALGAVGRVFLKPVVGANASHTRRFDPRVAVELAEAQAFLDALRGAHAMLLQPYFDSVEGEGEVSLIYFDDQFSHATRKIPVPGDYRVQDDWGASDEPWTPDAQAVALSERSLAAIGELARARGWGIELPLLYARVDLLRAHDGAWVLNELELIEPALFFRHDDASAGRFVDALAARL